MRPSVSSSNPAIVRSNVVLPQPEGPSSVKNSLSRMLSDTPFSALTACAVPAPNTLTALCSSTATGGPTFAPAGFATACSGTTLN